MSKVAAMLVRTVGPIWYFVTDLVENRFVLGQLVRRDLKEKYLGSMLGLFWPFLQQLLMVFIMGTVLQLGLRASTIGDYPFIIWLLPAQALFFFFNEALATSTGVFVQYSYLVKKIQFRVSILPLVKIGSALVGHLLFLSIVVAGLLFAGVPLSFYWFQSLYYLLAACLLLIGLSWLLSSLVVFLRDLGQVVQVVLSFLMWVTPLFWNKDSAGDWLRTVAWLNPVSYLVEGYRDSFLRQVGFWTDPWWALYFWGVTFTILISGVVVFRRLKPHFADVL